MHYSRLYCPCKELLFAKIIYKQSHCVPSLFIVLLDLLLSLIISYLLLDVTTVPEEALGIMAGTDADLSSAMWRSIQDFNIMSAYEEIVFAPPSWLFMPFDSDTYGWWVLFVASASLTSVWTLLILLSTAVVKLTPKLQRYGVWFFATDEHPVQAIGIASAALVMGGGLFWSTIRMLI